MLLHVCVSKGKLKIPFPMIQISTKSRGLFLKSPDNFLGQKSHLQNCYPLVLIGWSFSMFSRYLKAKSLCSLMTQNLSVLKIQRKLRHSKTCGIFEKRAPGLKVVIVTLISMGIRCTSPQL